MGRTDISHTHTTIPLLKGDSNHCQRSQRDSNPRLLARLTGGDDNHWSMGAGLIIIIDSLSEIAAVSWKYTFWNYFIVNVRSGRFFFYKRVVNQLVLVTFLALFSHHSSQISSFHQFFLWSPLSLANSLALSFLSLFIFSLFSPPSLCLIPPSLPSAPVSCLQYYRGLTGEIKSFNFDGVGCYSEDRWCDFSSINHASDCDITVGYTGMTFHTAQLSFLSANITSAPSLFD